MMDHQPRGDSDSVEEFSRQWIGFDDELEEGKRRPAVASSDPAAFEQSFSALAAVATEAGREHSSSSRRSTRKYLDEKGNNDGDENSIDLDEIFRVTAASNPKKKRGTGSESAVVLSPGSSPGSSYHHLLSSPKSAGSSSRRGRRSLGKSLQNIKTEGLTPTTMNRSMRRTASASRLAMMIAAPPLAEAQAPAQSSNNHNLDQLMNNARISLTEKEDDTSSFGFAHADEQGGGDDTASLRTWEDEGETASHSMHTQQTQQSQPRWYIQRHNSHISINNNRHKRQEHPPRETEVDQCLKSPVMSKRRMGSLSSSSSSTPQGEQTQNESTAPLPPPSRVVSPESFLPTESEPKLKGKTRGKKHKSRSSGSSSRRAPSKQRSSSLLNAQNRMTSSTKTDSRDTVSRKKSSSTRGRRRSSSVPSSDEVEANVPPIPSGFVGFDFAPTPPASSPLAGWSSPRSSRKTLTSALLNSPNKIKTPGSAKKKKVVINTDMDEVRQISQVPPAFAHLPSSKVVTAKRRASTGSSFSSSSSSRKDKTGLSNSDHRGHPEEVRSKSKTRSKTSSSSKKVSGNISSSPKKTKRASAPHLSESFVSSLKGLSDNTPKAPSRMKSGIDSHATTSTSTSGPTTFSPKPPARTKSQSGDAAPTSFSPRAPTRMKSGTAPSTSSRGTPKAPTRMKSGTAPTQKFADENEINRTPSEPAWKIRLLQLHRNSSRTNGLESSIDMEKKLANSTSTVESTGSTSTETVSTSTSSSATTPTEEEPQATLPALFRHLMSNNRSVSFRSKQKRKSKDDAPPELTWTRTPAGNFSDWTISVIGGLDSTYYVHRNVMAAGVRASSFFLEEFNNSGSSDSKNTTVLTLSKSPASAFPEMLDFMYGGTLRIRTDNALSLRYLGDHLSIKVLYHEASKFVQVDLNHTNIYKYFQAAQEVGDVQVLEACMVCAAHSWRNIRDSSDQNNELAWFVDLLTPDEKQMLQSLAFSTTPLDDAWKSVECEQ